MSGETSITCPFSDGCRRACATSRAIELEPEIYDDDDGGHRIGYCHQFHPPELFMVPLDQIPVLTPAAQARRERSSATRCNHRPKRGVGGKGLKTECMKRQLATFERFLRTRNHDGDESKLYALAKQCWFENKKRWDKAQGAEGQEKGYSSSKVMADAYKKLKP